MTKIFAEMLNRVRLGNPSTEDIANLGNRVVTNEELREIDVGSRGLILFPLRRQKDAMNDIELDKLPGTLRTYRAEDVDTGDRPITKNIRDYIARMEQTNTLLPASIRLKIGARVMLLRNRDIEHGWVNGKIATVVNMSDNYVVIADPNDPRIRLITHRVKQDIRYPNADGEYFRKQFPLDLAYGVTIHKSQGQTLDVVAVSAEGLNNSGQFYTAISRVRELDQLYFLRFDPDSIYLSDDIRKLIDWLSVADVLRPRSVDENIPRMPEVSQITCKLRDNQPKISPPANTNNGLAIKLDKTQRSRVANLPLQTPSAAKQPRIDTSVLNIDDEVHRALYAVSMIPVNIPLREYIRQFHAIAVLHSWTAEKLNEIAQNAGYVYDSRRVDHTVDQRLTDRFFSLFAEEQGHIICTAGDNSCMFHAFSLLIYGHQRNDRLFRWLCCVIFSLQSDYYADNYNSMHLEYESVQELIHNTALAVRSDSGQRIWGGAGHLKAMTDIARRDVYVYNVDVDPIRKGWPVAGLQEAIDTNQLRGSYHIRYVARQPLQRHQAITLLLSDGGTSAAHYSAILPLSVGLVMLKPAVVLPPQRNEFNEDIIIDQINIDD